MVFVCLFDITFELFSLLTMSVLSDIRTGNTRQKTQRIEKKCNTPLQTPILSGKRHNPAKNNQLIIEKTSP